MDKDWAEKEAMRVSAEATGVFSLSVSDEPWLRETITTLLLKVRREAKEEDAVIVDSWHIKKGGYGLLAQAIRESEGKV